MFRAGNSLFETLGGAKSIELMVADFYQSMLNDDDLNTYYLENVSEISELHYLLHTFCSHDRGRTRQLQRPEP